jgi:hypothetical protein
MSVTDASDHLYEPPPPAWSEVAKSIIPGAGAQIRSAVANLRRLANEDAIEAIAKRAEIDQDAAAAMQDMDAATPKDMSTVQQAAFSAGTSGIPTLAGVAAGILTRNPGIAMTLAGGGGAAMQAGSTYGEAREKGATHEVAAKAAGIDALLEGAGEALPLKFALKPGSAFAKRLAQTVVAEAGQEGATQIMQDLNAALSYNPDITLAEAWHNLQVATLAGGMGGAGYAGLGAAANRGQEKPAPMHQEAQEAAPVEPVEPAVVEPPAPVVEAPVAPPVETKPATAYDDLVPDPEGRASRRSRRARPRRKGRRSRGKSTDEQTVEPVDIKDERVRAELQHMVGEAGWAVDRRPGDRRAVHARRDARHQDRAGPARGGHRRDDEVGREGRMGAGARHDAGRDRQGGRERARRQAPGQAPEDGDRLHAGDGERAPGRPQRIGNEPWARSPRTSGPRATSRRTGRGRHDLVARAAEIDEAAVEEAARKYENDDAAFMEEVQEDHR